MKLKVKEVTMKLKEVTMKLEAYVTKVRYETATLAHRDGRKFDYLTLKVSFNVEGVEFTAKKCIDGNVFLFPAPVNYVNVERDYCGREYVQISKTKDKPLFLQKKLPDKLVWEQLGIKKYYWRDIVKSLRKKHTEDEIVKILRKFVGRYLIEVSSKEIASIIECYRTQEFEIAPALVEKTVTTKITTSEETYVKREKSLPKLVTIAVPV